jgi:hypothetical protein
MGDVGVGDERETSTAVVDIHEHVFSVACGVVNNTRMEACGMTVGSK